MQTGERVCYSPVNDEKGHFFTTDFGYDEINSCPDAVIAYNIARKGLMYIRSIRETEKGEKVTGDSTFSYLFDFCAKADEMLQGIRRNILTIEKIREGSSADTEMQESDF